MESKLAPLWREFENSLAEKLTATGIATWKAVFYAGAFACAWRISKHLTARGKNDLWMDELIVELDDAIRQQAAAEFAEERESPPTWNIEGTPLGDAFRKHLEDQDK